MAFEPTTQLKARVAPPLTPGTSGLATLAIAVVIVAGIGWALYYVLVGRWHESTDDAYVQGNVVSITPQATGSA